MSHELNWTLEELFFIMSRLCPWTAFIHELVPMEDQLKRARSPNSKLPGSLKLFWSLGWSFSWRNTFPTYLNTNIVPWSFSRLSWNRQAKSLEESGENHIYHTHELCKPSIFWKVVHSKAIISLQDQLWRGLSHELRKISIRHASVQSQVWEL